MKEYNDAPIVLTAGGTGGHMFPAEALAQELRARGRTVVLITDARGAAFAASFGRIETHVIAAANPSGQYAYQNFARQRRLLLARRRRVVCLRRQPPALVIGFGGYPALAGDGGGDLAWHSDSAA